MHTHTTFPDILVWIAIYIVVKTGINYLASRNPESNFGQALGILS